MTPQGRPQPAAKRYEFSRQQIIGGAAALLIVIFFLENWSALFSSENEITIRLIIPTVTMSAFYWLLILMLLGLVTGFFLGRARYKRRLAK